MVLQMAADQLFGQLDALRMGRARRHGAGIDGEKVAPGRQHVAAAPVGRAGGAGRHTLTVQGGEQTLTLARSLAEDMQPVAKPAFLDVADEAVDAGDRLEQGGIGGKAEVGGDAERSRLVADGADQAVAAGGIKAVGGGIFVQQAVQGGRSPAAGSPRPGAAAGGQGSRPRCGAWPARPRRGR